MGRAVVVEITSVDYNNERRKPMDELKKHVTMPQIHIGGLDNQAEE